MSNRNKYLPGLSYGQMGGPWPLSWGRKPLDADKDDRPWGRYTFEISRGSEILGQVSFGAGSMSEAERFARYRCDEMGGTHWSYLTYVREV